MEQQIAESAQNFAIHDKIEGQPLVVKETLHLSALTTSRLPLVAHSELVYQDWIIPVKVREQKHPPYRAEM